MIKFARLALIAVFAIAATTASFAQDKVTKTIDASAHLETILDLKVTGGAVEFHFDTKQKYKQGIELNNTTVEICATCDWRLKYDIHKGAMGDIVANGNDWDLKGSKGHRMPLGLVGMMIKPAASATTFYANNITNHYATTKRLTRWGTILEPKAGKSNIGEEVDTKFKIWWSIGQSWTGSNLLDEQVHADWYAFKMYLTLMCVH